MYIYRERTRAVQTTKRTFRMNGKRLCVYIRACILYTIRETARGSLFNDKVKMTGRRNHVLVRSRGRFYGSVALAISSRSTYFLPVYIYTEGTCLLSGDLPERRLLFFGFRLSKSRDSVTAPPRLRGYTINDPLAHARLS